MTAIFCHCKDVKRKGGCSDFNLPTVFADSEICSSEVNTAYAIGYQGFEIGCKKSNF